MTKEIVKEILDNNCRAIRELGKTNEELAKALEKTNDKIIKNFFKNIIAEAKSDLHIKSDAANLVLDMSGEIVIIRRVFQIDDVLFIGGVKHGKNVDINFDNLPNEAKAYVFWAYAKYMLYDTNL